MKKILLSWYGVIAGGILSEESKNAKYHISYIICYVLVGKKGKQANKNTCICLFSHTHKEPHERKTRS